MNEYYKVRYNLSKFFLNIDSNTYENYLNIIIPILYLIPFLLLGLLLFTFIKSYDNIINITTMIYIIMIVILVFISYKLINSLKDIQTNPIIKNYYEYYNLANIIYRENYMTSKTSYVQSEIKNKLLKNIGNIENLYGEKARKLLNTTKDILQYDDNINEEFTTKLYIDNTNKPLNKHYIQEKTPYDDYKIKYIDLKIMEEYYGDTDDKKTLLDYLNKKYNSNLTKLYIPSIFTGNFNKGFHTMISNYKYNIYLYLVIIVYFILILFQGLLLNLNGAISYIYLAIIIILIILMYIINNNI